MKALPLIAVINVFLTPVWLLAFFGMASLAGNVGSNWVRDFLWIIPVHIALSVYALLHQRLLSESVPKDVIGAALTLEQILSLGVIAYGWSQVGG